MFVLPGPPPGMPPGMREPPPRMGPPGGRLFNYCYYKMQGLVLVCCAP